MILILCDEPVVFGLSTIFRAPRRALLLGRAELVEVFELAAGEQEAVPLAV
jgi:hypothetical protein